MKLKRALILLAVGFVFLTLVGCFEKENDKKSELDDDKKGSEIIDDDKKDDEPKEHVHAYNVKRLEEQFKISEATCEKGSVYYYSCECGEKGTETFEAFDALGHTLLKGCDFRVGEELIEEGLVRVYFRCSVCGEDVYKDFSKDNHDHICHEAISITETSHEATCAICGEVYINDCIYDDFNECIYCDNELAPTYGDALWKVEIYDDTEKITQNDVKAYFYGKGEETYDDITVTVREVTYNTGIGCSMNKENKKFQYELENSGYFLMDGTEINAYGWNQVSFRISKCVDAVGKTDYYKFSNGDIGIHYICTEECKIETYNLYNEKGQLILYKQIEYNDEENITLKVYTYSYGKEWLK